MLSPLRIRAANHSEVSRRTGWLDAECPDESGFVRQMLAGISAFWRVLPSRSPARPPNPIVGDFLSVATDRCVLGSNQARLVLKREQDFLKENKTMCQRSATGSDDSSTLGACSLLSLWNLGKIVLTTAVGKLDWPRFGGVVAQLVERLNGIQEVRGSNPLGSTSQSENEKWRGFLWFSSQSRTSARTCKSLKILFE